MEWSERSSRTRNSTYPEFRNHLLKIIRPVSNPVDNTQNYIGLNLLTTLRLGLSHLNEDRLIIIFKIVSIRYLLVV